MKRTILAAAISMFLTGTALASEWVVIAESSTGDVVSLDMKSAVLVDNMAKVWIRHQHSQPERLNDGEYYMGSIHQTVINCSQRTLRILAETYYRADGGVVRVDSRPDPEFRDPPPDSIGQDMIFQSCLRTGAAKAKATKPR